MHSLEMCEKTNEGIKTKETWENQKKHIMQILPLSPSLSLFRSVSMIDMRGEEEAMLQPHSQVRHELMHNQYNRMKEEEDHWQDVSVSHLSHVFLFF